jgi:hypothetical protein
MAWAYLEVLCEQTLWGMLKLDKTHGPLVTWRLDMRARWQMILDKSNGLFSSEDEKIIRQINKGVTIAARDRNIIVHGVIHSIIATNDLKRPEAFWTVFRGADAGKKFTVATIFVQIVCENIQLLCKRMEKFNKDHSYQSTSLEPRVPEQGWPKRVE